MTPSTSSDVVVIPAIFDANALFLSRVEYTLQGRQDSTLHSLLLNQEVNDSRRFLGIPVSIGLEAHPTGKRLLPYSSGPVSIGMRGPSSA